MGPRGVCPIPSEEPFRSVPSIKGFEMLLSSDDGQKWKRTLHESSTEYWGLFLGDFIIGRLLVNLVDIVINDNDCDVVIIVIITVVTCVLLLLKSKKSIIICNRLRFLKQREKLYLYRV